MHVLQGRGTSEIAGRLFIAPYRGGWAAGSGPTA